MPITFRFLPERRLYIARWTGSVDDAQMLAAYRRVYEGPSPWEQGFNEVADVRGCSVTATRDGIRQLVEVTARAVGDGPFKSAAIVDADLPFGLARMYEAFAVQSPEQVGVFRSVEEAAAHVGCPVELLDENQPG